MDETWKEFFEDKKSWSHGPTYDLTLLVRSQYSKKELDNALVKNLGLEIWKGKLERGVNSSIMYLGEDKQPIGLYHNYLKHENSIASMQLSVYKAQMDRIVNTLERSRQLNLAFIDITRKLSKRFPVMCATICDETDAYVFPPEIAGRSICFTKSSYENSGLDMPYRELKHPWEGYFAIAMDG